MVSVWGWGGEYPDTHLEKTSEKGLRNVPKEILVEKRKGISEGSYSICKDSKCPWKITSRIPTQEACL